MKIETKVKMIKVAYVFALIMGYIAVGLAVVCVMMAIKGCKYESMDDIACNKQLAWFNGTVEYTFSVHPDTTVNETEKVWMRETMDYVESVIPITFRPVEKTGINVLLIMKSGSWYATIGQYTLSDELLRIGYYKDETQYKQTALHELGHVLGMYHEHQRLDRDKTITIQWENVMEYYIERFGFSNRPEDQNRLYNYYDWPFDLDSVMMYCSDCGSKQVGVPVYIINDDPDRWIYRKDVFSEIDIQKLNHIYGD
jgi:hypothetical protein